MTVYGALGGAGSAGRDEQAEKRKRIRQLLSDHEFCPPVTDSHKTITVFVPADAFDIVEDLYLPKNAKPRRKRT